MTPPNENVNERDDDTFCNVASIQGFSALFGPVSGASTKTSIRFGSTLLISGPPGAGKTTFALATVRAMMASAKRKTKGGRKTIAYYVSSEVHQEQLQENFRDFGWFQGSISEDTAQANGRQGSKISDAREPDAEDRAVQEHFKFYIESRIPDQTNFYAITPMPEVDRPVPSPEELVNGIFNRIVHTLLPSEAPNEKAKIYVIIDSISALLKGCVNSGDERRQTHEIMRRLQDRFGADHLALTVVLAEQDHRSQDIGITSAPTTPTAPSVEDYLADMVFRLYVRSLPLGRRSRILEVVKSQGANMTLGEHTWQIISEANHKEILRYDGFRNAIKEKCLESLRNSEAPIDKDFLERTTPSPSSVQSPAPPTFGDVSQWGGVIIFPRPRLQYEIDSFNSGRRDDQDNAPDIDGVPASGTKNLHLSVAPGTITLIAGPIGAGKTELCKQFLSWGDPEAGKQKRFLISFDIPNRAEKEGLKYEPLHFTQSQFDLNVLVAHIDWIIENRCDRLAFDGLSEWITMFQKPEAARVLEALMVTVRRWRGQKIAPPIVFMTYEMPLDDNPLNPATLGAAADHLVIVRQVPINDELRKVIYVLKDSSGTASDDGPTPQHPCELKRVRDRFEVDTTSLEAYTGLLSSRHEVKPARVLIQLFDENIAERQYNRQRVTRLKSQFAKRIDLTSTRFTLSEIGSTLDSAYGAGKPGEAFNLTIHSIDEWWLKAQNTANFLRDLRTPDSSNGPNYRDFWWFEVEKGLGPARPEAAPDANDEPWHAIPGYIDFGMFCINFEAMCPAVLDKLTATIIPKRDRKATAQMATDSTEVPDGAQTGARLQLETLLHQKRKLWRHMLHAVPRLWAKTIDRGSHDWFEIGDPESMTILAFALQATDQHERKTNSWRDNLRRKHVFSFDSSTRETSACMFFELAWAFGASESFLGSQVDTTDGIAARKALLFLQFLVMEGLMPARSSPESKNQLGEPILFTRHWYSTFRKEMETNADTPRNKKRTTDYLANKPKGSGASASATQAIIPGLMVLPFMPSGQDGTDAVHSLLQDIAVRQHYWLRRAQQLHRDLAGSGGPTLVSLEKLSASLLRSDSVGKGLKLALNCYALSRQWVLEMAKIAYRPESDESKITSSNAEAPRWTPDLNDLIELAAWAAFRLQLLFGQSDGKFPLPIEKNDPIAGALHEARWVRHSLPDLGHLNNRTAFRVANVVTTGYVCSGSWMYGVSRKSRSSEIQAQVLGELTSLDSAEERSLFGAGMSARKDFFYLNGEKQAKGMEYLHWWELLRFGGSRSRRRDRVLDKRTSCSGGETWQSRAPSDPGLMYDAIHRELLACLRIADLYRQQYALGGSSAQSALEIVSLRAAKATVEIYNSGRTAVGEVVE